MEPLTAGAGVFVLWLLNKVIDWSADKALDQASQRVMELLKEKSPDTAQALEAAAAQGALPPGEREDIGEAVLIEQVNQAAQTDPEIKAAVEALGNDVKQTTKENPELERRLTKVIENWKGINIKGGFTTINQPTFHF